jgi:hypothetical protein
MLTLVLGNLGEVKLMKILEVVEIASLLLVRAPFWIVIGLL